MKTTLRVGSLCAVTGTVVYVVFGVLHGTLTGRNGVEVVFRHVLERPYWSAIHLAAMFGISLWLGAIVALARGTSDNDDSKASSMIGNLAVVFMTIGTAVAFLHFAIDGYVLKNLADSWAMGSPAEQENIVRIGEFLQRVLREPLFVTEVIFLQGLPFALVALLVARGRNYPAWGSAGSAS